MFCQPHLEVVSPWQSLQKQGGDFLSFTYQPMNTNDANQIKPDKMDSEAGSEPFCTVLWFASCYRHQPRWGLIWLCLCRTNGACAYPMAADTPICITAVVTRTENSFNISLTVPIPLLHEHTTLVGFWLGCHDSILILLQSPCTTFHSAWWYFGVPLIFPHVSAVSFVVAQVNHITLRKWR